MPLPSLNFNAGDITRGMQVGENIAASRTRRKLAGNQDQRAQGEYDSGQAGIKAQRMLSVLKASTPEESTILNSVYFPGTKMQWNGPEVQMQNPDGTIVVGPKAALLTMQKMIAAGADPMDAHQYAIDNGVIISNPQKEAADRLKNMEQVAAQIWDNLPPEEKTRENYIEFMGELEAITKKASGGSDSPPNTFEAVLARQMDPNTPRSEILSTAGELYGQRPVNTLEGVLARQSQGTQAQGPLENAAALTAAKKTAEVTAGKTAEAKFDVGKAVDAAEQSMAIIDKAIKHPGRETATGKSGVIDPRNYIPGTEAKNFQVVLDQIKGKAFLQAFQSLKGGGQITEAEGQKATEAMARLNRKQSDEAFLESLEELKSIVNTGVLRAKQQASGTEPVPIEVGTVESGYKFKGGDPGDPKNWEKVSQ